MKFNWFIEHVEAVAGMLVSAFLGGVAQYARKIEAGRATFSIAELVGEACIAGSSAMIAGMGTLAYDPAAPLPAICVVSGLAAHMGTRLIFAAESILIARMKAVVGMSSTTAESGDATRSTEKTP